MRGTRRLGNWRGPMGARGMTLVEIMIVITIMAAIMGVVGYNVIGTMNEGNTQIAETEIDKLRGTLNTYYMMQQPNRYPDTLDELTAGANPLLKGDSKLKDPWGNRYIYKKRNNQQFELYSAGPDGSPNTEDDIDIQDE